MKLIFKGKILKDEDNIESLKITEGCCLHLVVSKRNIHLFIFFSILAAETKPTAPTNQTYSNPN